MRKNLVLSTTVLLALLMSSFAGLVGAQEAEDDFTFEVVITGMIEELSADGIVVDGVTIAPAGAFNPADLSLGDYVEVTGEFLNDNTLQASALEVVEGDDLANPQQQDDGDDDDDDEDGVTVVICHAPPGNPSKAHSIRVGEGAVANHLRHGDTEGPCAGDEGVVEEDDRDDDEDGVCNATRRHPVAVSLAEEFDYDAETLQTWHCDGFGYGEIARALLIEEALEGEVSAEEVLARKAAGEGWGKIIRDYGLHPRDLAPGRVLGKGKGQGKGNANGNGRGNANGNANGNGRGNGNGGDDD